MEETMIITEVPNKRRKVTKFALAAVAVLGVSAAATSAAWSDNVFFGAEAAAADFELQGWDPANGWVDADNGAARIILPADILNEVGPGISDSYTLTVRNDGDLPIYLNDIPVATTTGALFRGGDPALVSFGNFSDMVLENAGDQATFDVIVTGDADWDNSDYQGRVGSIVIQVEGSSSAPVATP